MQSLQLFSHRLVDLACLLEDGAPANGSSSPRLSSLTALRIVQKRDSGFVKLEEAEVLLGLYGFAQLPVSQRQGIVADGPELR